MFYWGLGFCLTLVTGKLLEAASLPVLAPFPLVGLLIALVLLYRESRERFALVGSLLVVLIARSSLAPGILTSTTPIWVSILCGLAAALSSRRLPSPKNTTLVLLFGLSLLVPTFLQLDPGTSTKAVGIVAMWILVFFVSANTTRADRCWLMRFFVAIASIEILIAISESLLQIGIVRQFVAGSAESDSYVVRQNLILGSWVNRAQGTAGYPIPFAAFIVVALLAAIFGHMFSRRFTMIVVLSLLGAGILLSGARSGVVALAVGVFFGLIPAVVSYRNRRRRVHHLWLLGTSATIVAGVGITFLIRAIATEDFSFMHRAGILGSAWNLTQLPILRIIFGSGYDSTMRLYAEGVFQSDGATVIDNAFVSTVITSGLVGLVALCLLLGLSWVKANPAGKATIASIAAFMFFFDVFGWHLISFLLFVIIGMVTPMANTQPSDAQTGREGKIVAARNHPELGAGQEGKD